MFSHHSVWSAIDTLAQLNDMSVSRLARNAGLDPTTFNKSKRVASDGRLRWPSTESLSKILLATQIDSDAFISLMKDPKCFDELALTELQNITSAQPQYASRDTVPLLGLAQAGRGGFFDDGGFPSGEGWDAVDFPKQDYEQLYALEISGESMMPLYRDGDRIIVSPNSSVRRGDRVVVRTHLGEVMAKVLTRQTAKTIELESLNPNHENCILKMADIDWVARIVWASQ